HATHRDALHRLDGGFEIGGGHAGHSFGQSLDCQLLSKSGFAQISHHELPVTRFVWNRHNDLFAETAAPQNPRVNPIEIVGSADEKDLVFWLQRANLYQRLLNQLDTVRVHLSMEFREQA